MGLFAFPRIYFLMIRSLTALDSSRSSAGRRFCRRSDSRTCKRQDLDNLSVRWILLSYHFFIDYLKYEVSRKKATRNGNKEGEKETSSTLYEDEIWRPCLKGINPVWLLGLRVFAFVVLLVLFILIATEDGGSIFFFYT
ncbi:hypothetical protein GYH30_006941 [Glycine max]|nr:hypothetical protein GYH30_006941 [Glycine max]